MIEELKRRSSATKRYAIVGCAVAIILLPSFMLDAVAALAIVAMALIGSDKAE